MSDPASFSVAPCSRPPDIASRRESRWPSANVDGPSARRFTEIRPGRKNAAQPNKKHHRSYASTILQNLTHITYRPTDYRLDPTATPAPDPELWFFHKWTASHGNADDCSKLSLHFSRPPQLQLT
jgi:hypothetical protein